MSISPPASAFEASPQQAVATSTLNGQGGVGAVNLTFGGNGYSNPPTVTIQPPPPGIANVQATAVAQVLNGTVVGITVTNPGVGYTSAPTDHDRLALQRRRRDGLGAGDGDVHDQCRGRCQRREPGHRRQRLLDHAAGHDHSLQRHPAHHSGNGRRPGGGRHDRRHRRDQPRCGLHRAAQHHDRRPEPAGNGHGQGVQRCPDRHHAHQRRHKLLHRAHSHAHRRRLGRRLRQRDGDRPGHQRRRHRRAHRQPRSGLYLRTHRHVLRAGPGLDDLPRQPGDRRGRGQRRRGRAPSR